jgi:thymidylate kinase
MVSRLSPKPDFLVLLDNDPNTIWSRKREYPIETINSVLQRYHRVAVQHGAIVVRTDRSPDEVAASFLETYWRAIIRLRRDRLRFWGVA